MRVSEEFTRMKEAINEGGEKFIFLCNDVVHALSVSGLFDDLSIVSYERSPVSDALRGKDVPVYLLEDNYPGYDKLKTTNNLVSHDFFKDTLARFGNVNKNLLVFKNSAIVEEHAKSLGLKLLMSDSSKGRAIENKVKFYDELKEEGVKVVPGTTLMMTDALEYDKLIGKFGDEFVLQASKGFSGAKTYFIKDKLSFNSVKDAYLKRKMRLTKFIDGVTVTINACTTSLGCIVKPPFFQLTGIDNLTANDMGACGNNFDISSLSPSVVDDIISETRRIGEIIYQKGYRGIFGIDYIVSEDESWFIECNPRLITSLPAFTRLEIENGEVPLLALHVLENMGKIELAADILDKYKDVNTDRYTGTQLILHNLSDEPRMIKNELRCGIYSAADGSLTFLREALCRDEINTDDEMLIFTKARDATVNPNMECARILTKASTIVDNRLNDKIKDTITAFYEELF